MGNTGSTQTADDRAVFAAAAHSLNNLIALLYRAEDGLDDAPEWTERAAMTQALATASGAGRALSAALQVLLLRPEDHDPALLARAWPRPFDANDATRLLATLAEVGAVRAAPDAKGALAAFSPVWPRIDRDAMAAILVCAAAALRAVTGPRTRLSCRVRTGPDTAAENPGAAAADDGRAALHFTLEHEDGQDDPDDVAGAALKSQHPCALALARLPRLLPESCATLRPGARTLTLSFTAHSKLWRT